MDSDIGRRDCLKLLGGTLIAAMTPACIAAEQPVSQPKTLKTGLLADPIYKEHDTGPGFPESAARYDAIVNALEKADLGLEHIKSRAATEEELLLCHTAEYIKTVRHDVEAGERSLSTGDTVICKKSLDVALAAAGGVLAATDAVVERRIKNAYCVVRPPGHHATPTRGMGFCIFNNLALAARYAQKKHKLRRVLIYDWDVHHGNGTQDIFYEDGSVFFCSTHQWPLYPGTGRADETGRGAGIGTTLNFPFPAGSGRKEILGAVQEKLVPAADRFKPDLVLISAGFDSREGDPLGRFTLTDADFADLTDVMLEIAAKHAGGRLLSVLEGGYNLSGIASASVAHVRALTKA